MFIKFKLFGALQAFLKFWSSDALNSFWSKFERPRYFGLQLSFAYKFRALWIDLVKNMKYNKILYLKTDSLSCFSSKPRSNRFENLKFGSIGVHTLLIHMASRSKISRLLAILEALLEILMNRHFNANWKSEKRPLDPHKNNLW